MSSRASSDVPFLLEAFPSPPSHIPPPPNPPPSLPPSAPLPPVPGPSPLSDRDTLLFITSATSTARPRRSSKLSLLSTRSTSPAPSPPSLSPTAATHPISARPRKGSLSSLLSVQSSASAPLRPPQGAHALAISEEVPAELTASPDSFPAHSPEPLSPRLDIPDVLRPSFTRKPDPNPNDSIASIDLSTLHDDTTDADDHDHAPATPLPFPKPNRPLSPDATRATSPDVTQIISATPRPRKRSASSQPRSRVSSLSNNHRTSSHTHRSSTHSKKAGVRSSSESLMLPYVEPTPPAWKGDEREAEHDSDSSIDLHTPLPHLMLRHGLLSPHSKLLPTPEPTPDPGRMSMMSTFSNSSAASGLSSLSAASTSALSVASISTLNSNASVTSKNTVPKDARDTPRRRVRHRDGRLLRGGIGLTTGLGWSDSEDEDAPSPLTRRLSSLNLSRRASSLSAHSHSSHHSAPSQSSLYNPHPSPRSAHSAHPLSRSISHSVLREADEYEYAEFELDEFGYVRGGGAASGCEEDLNSKSLPSRVLRRGSGRSAGTRSSTFSAGARSSTFSAGAQSRSSTFSAGSRGSRYSAASTGAVGGGTGLALSIPEHESLDGVTPTQAAFSQPHCRSSQDHGYSREEDKPRTPSSTSTASSLSLPFPATPESANGSGLDAGGAGWNKDKVLPPLPPPTPKLGLGASPLDSSGGLGAPFSGTGAATPKNKYPANLGLRMPSGMTMRERSGSTASVGRASREGLRGPSPTPGYMRGAPSPAPTHAPPPAPSSARGAPSPAPSYARGAPSPAPGSVRGAPSPAPNYSRPTGSAAGVSSPRLGAISRLPPLLSMPAPTRSSTLPTPSVSTHSPGTTPRPLRLTSSSLSRKGLQPGEQPPRPGQVLQYNRNVHDQLKRGGPGSPTSPGGGQTLLIPPSSGLSTPMSGLSTPMSGLSTPVSATSGLTPPVTPLSASSPGGLSSSGSTESLRPKPRTGTGMVYRNSPSSVGAGASRMRMPSASPRPAGAGIAL